MDNLVMNLSKNALLTCMAKIAPGTQTMIQAMIQAFRNGRHAASVCCLLVLVACTQAPPPLPLAAAGPYRLDPGDTVRLIVYNQQSLSTDYVVGNDGMISVPMIGQVKASTRTVQELQQDIYNRLNNGILVNPGVSVELSQARPVSVLGEVNRPGQYPYQSQMSVLGAVAAAGGFTVRADQGYVVISRSAQGQSLQGSAKPLDGVQPGDVIMVHERFF
jgi:polysaccharide export outer membrane protein